MKRRKENNNDDRKEKRERESRQNTWAEENIEAKGERGKKRL